MLSRTELGKSKLVRLFIYILVLGFSFLLLLPASFQVRDLLKKNKASFIQINDEEIFFQSYPLSNKISQGKEHSISSLLNIIIQNKPSNQLQKLQYKFLIQGIFKSILGELDEKSSAIITNNIISQVVRELIKQVIIVSSLGHLAEDLEFKINPKDLNELVEKHYKQKLAEEYQQLLKKASQEGSILSNQEKYYAQLSFNDFLTERSNQDWNYFYNWGVNNFKKQYFISVLNSSLKLANIPLITEVNQELKIQNHKIKLEYIIYSPLDHIKFLKETSLKNLINEATLKEMKDLYFDLYQQKMQVEYITFKSKEKALHAKSNKNLFSSKSKYIVKRATLDFSQEKNNKLYQMLDQYEVNDITDVLNYFNWEKEKKEKAKSKDKSSPYAIYKIINRSKSFDSLKKEIEKGTSKFIDVYLLMKYPQFKSSFEEKLNQIKKLLEEKKSLSHKALLKKHKKELEFVKYGETEMFNLNKPSVTLEKTNKGISSLLFSNSKLNIPFFTKAYLVNKGESFHLTQPYELLNNQNSIIDFQTSKLKDKSILKKKSKNYHYLVFGKKIDSQIDKIPSKQSQEYMEYINKINQRNLKLISDSLLKFLLKEKKIKININYNNIFELYDLN